MVRCRQDVSREKGHLGSKGEFPGGICSLSSIICFGNTWVGSWGGIYEDYFREFNTQSILGNISYLEPTGRGRFLYRGCPLKDADRPRGASGGSLILDTWTLSSSLWLLSPLTLMPPHPQTPVRPPGVGYQLWVFVGVCASIVSVNSRTIHPPNACSPNSGKHIPLATTHPFL